MADNIDVQSTTGTSLPPGTKLAAFVGSLSGDSNAAVGPVVLCSVSGSEGSWVFAPIAPGNPLDIYIRGDAGAASVLDSELIAAVTLNTKRMMDGATTVTPKFAVIAAAASGNNTLVAAVASKKIRVLAYNFIANGSVNAKFQSGASGTDLTGLKYCVVNGGLVAPFNPVGWFETAVNTLLNLNLSGAVAVGGELTYVEVA